MCEAPITMLVDLENPDSGDILRMYLGSTSWRAGDVNRLGDRADGSNSRPDGLAGQADAWRGLTDGSNQSNSTETAVVSQGDNTGTYLRIRGTKCDVEKSDGLGNQTDASSIRMDAYTIGNETETAGNEAETISMHLIDPKPQDPLTMRANACANEPNGCGNPADTLTGYRGSPSVETDRETTANATETVRIPQIESKLQNSPIETAKWSADGPNDCGNQSDASSGCVDVHSTGNNAQMAIDEAKTVRMPPNEPKMQNIPAGAERRHAGVAGGFRSHADTLTMRKDTHTVANDAGTAENASRNIRKCQNDSKTRDSPYISEDGMPKRWRRVNADDGDVYLPLSAPIDSTSRIFAFGEVESGDEAIAPNVEGEKAGDGDGDPNGGDSGDGDADGTTSGSSIDSSRVKTVWLARESQHMRYSRRIQEGNSPVSPRPPIRHPDCLYEDVRRRR